MLVRHALLYAIGKILPGLLGMATTALLTRLLDPSAYGVYGLALVVMIFGSTLAFDWLGVAFMRFYQSRRDDSRAIGTFVVIFAGLVGATFGLAAAAWGLGWLSGAAGRVYAAGIVMMWSYAWFELVSRFEIADFRPGRYVAMNIGRGGLSLMGAAGAAALTRDPVWTACGTSLGTMLGALLGRRRTLLGGFDATLARAVCVFGLPMAASMAMSSVANGGTRALVAWLGSPAALGYYTAAFMLVQNTLVVAGAGIASAGYSLAVRALESGDAAALDRQLRANATLLLAVLAPAALGMALTAPDMAATLVGPRYAATVAELTPWMACGSLFAAFRGNYLDHAFQLGKNPVLQIWVTATQAAVAIGLCLVLIPARGPMGAAMATAAGAVAACVLAWAIGARAFPMPLPAGPLLRIGAASAAMGLGVRAVPGSGPEAFSARMLVGAVVYLSVAVGLDILGARGVLLRGTARALPWTR